MNDVHPDTILNMHLNKALKERDILLKKIQSLRVILANGWSKDYLSEKRKEAFLQPQQYMQERLSKSGLHQDFVNPWNE